MNAINGPKDKVIIKTRRGRIIIGPHGNIDGIWRIARLELRNAAEVRKMCGGISRHTLINWRSKPQVGFPAPVLTLKGSGYNAKIELFSRSQIEDWLAQR